VGTTQELYYHNTTTTTKTLNIKPYLIRFAYLYMLINANDLVLNGVQLNYPIQKKSDCSFLTKAINAENAGARMLLIADNDPLNEIMIDMVDDGTKRLTYILSGFIRWKDGLGYL
jgi:hypothetical protein